MVTTIISVKTNLYRLEIEPTEKRTSKTTKEIVYLAKETMKRLHLWHKRLGHVSMDTIKKMAISNTVDGLPVLNGTEGNPFCDGCMYGKQHRSSLPKDGRNRAKSIGELIHSDVCGPMSVPSLGGSRYFVLFKDDFSGYMVVKLLKQKSDVLNEITAYVAQLRTQTGKQVVTLRTDNGGEYTSNDFSDWLSKNGIRHETSVPKTPEQNGDAERMNRTIVESARSMLHSSGLSTNLWAEAVSCSVYILNRIITKSVEGRTPYEWYGKKPNVSHMRIFGAEAFVHVPRSERSKFDSKSIKCVHVGYCETQKAFRLYDPNSRKVLISRDVIFNEERLKENNTISLSKFLNEVSTNEPALVEGIEADQVVENKNDDQDSTQASGTLAEMNKERKKKIIEPREPSALGQRDRRPPIRWGDESYSPV